MFIQSNVELNYLIIYLYGSNKEGKAFPIHLAFSKEREDRHNYKYSAWMCNAVSMLQNLIFFFDDL